MTKKKKKLPHCDLCDRHHAKQDEATCMQNLEDTIYDLRAELDECQAQLHDAEIKAGELEGIVSTLVCEVESAAGDAAQATANCI